MIKIVAYKTIVHGNVVEIQDSEGESIQSSDVEELIAFLNTDHAGCFTIKVFFNLDESVAPILRKLGTSACREIASASHTWGPIFYIPSKIFSVQTEKHKSFFYHLEQYFQDDYEPEDVDEIAAMAQLVMDAFHAMNLNPKSLISPISVYEKEILHRMKIPTILNIPGDHEKIIEFAEECTGRLWIQAYQMGHWEEGDVWEFDLTAAYPSVAAKLRSFQYAKYAHGSVLDETADWGFLRGTIKINDDVNISPMMYFDGQTNIHPTGSWDTTITLQDYQFLKLWKIGDFKIDEAYYIKFTAPVQPLEQAVKRIFNQRGQGGLISQIAKRIATGGFYGKFIQKYDDGTPGDYYNPLYAAMINSINNIKVATFIYKNGLQNDTIHVGVDSVTATKPVKIPARPAGMGSWKLSGIGPVLVLSSGRVYHGDKKPHGLTYDKIIELVKEKPNETYYTANLRRRQTLEESIQLNDLNGLGKMKETTSSFDLNLLRGATDRIYPKFPHNGRELIEGQYQSRPVKI